MLGIDEQARVVGGLALSYDLMMTKDQGTSNNGADGTRAVPINFKIRDGEPIWAVDRVLVQDQTDDNMLIVSLFQSSPPIILRDGDADKVEALDAYCIVRFAMTPAKTKEIMSTILGYLVRNHAEIMNQEEGK